MSLWDLTAVGLSFAVSCGLSWVLCASPLRGVSLDRPNERSLHAVPTPRTGGLAILAGAGVSLALAVVRAGASPTRQTAWLVVAIALVSAVSFVDDRVGLPPAARFLVQAAAASGVVWGARLRWTEISLPLLGSRALGVWALPLTLLFLLWMANLYNFMDGMDGFAGGMALWGCLFLAAAGWLSGDAAFAVVCLVVAAGAGGFLVFNFPPARLFMGDVGSVSLGFGIALLALEGGERRLFPSWLPLLVFSPFIVDATLTLLRRLARGVRPWQPHREHWYQRLVLAGWSHRKTVVVEYGLMLACGASALGATRAGERAQVAALLAWSGFYAAAGVLVRRAERLGGAVS